MRLCSVSCLIFFQSSISFPFHGFYQVLALEKASRNYSNKYPSALSGHRFSSSKSRELIDAIFFLLSSALTGLSCFHCFWLAVLGLFRV
jgi:hypothetical protein